MYGSEGKGIWRVTLCLRCGANVRVQLYPWMFIPHAGLSALTCGRPADRVSHHAFADEDLSSLSYIDGPLRLL